MFSYKTECLIFNNFKFEVLKAKGLYIISE